MAEDAESIKGRKANEVELFFLQAEREEFVAGLGRMSDAARQLITSVGVVAGLYLAVLQFKIKTGAATAIDAPYLPVILWGCTIVFAVITIVPLPYKHIQNSPKDIARSLAKSHRVKWWFLIFSALTFIAGLVFAVKSIIPT
ncbi:MAG: hypothetical protein DWQ05_13390 [Calditrichaeota bacterium]|nr:MAG: hypothetical protein DWQ05_13390 [Calditrichota bacterium]